MENKVPPQNPYYNDLPPPYHAVSPPPHHAVSPPPHHAVSPPLHHAVSPPLHAEYLHGTTIGSTTYIHQTAQPTYGAIPVIVQPSRATDVIVVGGCPACRVGVLSEEFTLAGLCCAFWFFPIGILCCLGMKERRCTNCGAIFS